MITQRQYLRLRSTFRMLEAGRIGRVRAIELLAERDVARAAFIVDAWLDVLDDMTREERT